MTIVKIREYDQYLISIAGCSKCAVLDEPPLIAWHMASTGRTPIQLNFLFIRYLPRVSSLCLYLSFFPSASSCFVYSAQSLIVYYCHYLHSTVSRLLSIAAGSS